MVDINNQELKQAIETFYFAYREFTRGPDQILSRKKLNRVHHRVLYFVGRNPGISVNELLQLLQVSKQALNAPLRTLLEKKLVSSQSAEHDKRIRQLFLTAAGKKLEDELTHTQMQLLQNVFGEYDRGVFQHWLEVMQKTGNMD